MAALLNGRGRTKTNYFNKFKGEKKSSSQKDIAALNVHKTLNFSVQDQKIDLNFIYHKHWASLGMLTQLLAHLIVCKTCQMTSVDMDLIPYFHLCS